MSPSYQKKAEVISNLVGTVEGIHIAITEAEYVPVDIELNIRFGFLWRARNTLPLRTGHLIADLAGKIAAGIPEELRGPQHWRGPKPAQLKHEKREKSFAIARRHLETMNERQQEDEEGIEFVLVEEYCHELPYGWLFAYNSREYIETRDFMYAIAGNGPFVVDLELDHIEYFPTYAPPSKFLFRYNMRRKWHLFLKWLKGAQ